MKLSQLLIVVAALFATSLVTSTLLRIENRLTQDQIAFYEAMQRFCVNGWSASFTEQSATGTLACMGRWDQGKESRIQLFLEPILRKLYL